MVRPAEKLLRVWIDQLREKDPVERWVLANKDCFFAPYAMAGKNIDDGLRNMAGCFALRNLIPGKTINAQAFLIALFPSFNRLSDETLIFFFEFTIGQIDNFKCDLQNFVNLRIESVRFCIEEYAYHCPIRVRGSV